MEVIVAVGCADSARIKQSALPSLFALDIEEIPTKTSFAV